MRRDWPSLVLQRGPASCTTTTRIIWYNTNVARQLKPCGTRAAYERHRRKGEVPCDECKAANSARTGELLKQEHHRQRHNEWQRKRKKERYHNDPEFRERDLAKSKAYRENASQETKILHNIQVTEYLKDKYQNDPEHRRKVLDYQAGRQSHKRDKIIQELENRHGPNCFYCGCVLDNGSHIDHVVPVSRGADPSCNDLDNLRLACPECNWSKHNSYLSDWAIGRNLTKAAEELALQDPR